MKHFSLRIHHVSWEYERDTNEHSHLCEVITCVPHLEMISRLDHRLDIPPEKDLGSYPNAHTLPDMQSLFITSVLDINGKA